MGSCALLCMLPGGEHAGGYRPFRCFPKPTESIHSVSSSELRARMKATVKCPRFPAHKFPSPVLDPHRRRHLQVRHLLSAP